MSNLAKIFLLVFSGYFASFVLYFINFEKQDSASATWAKRLMTTSLFAHLLSIGYLFAQNRHFAITDFSAYIFITTFLLLLVSFFLESRYGLRFLMLFSLPIGLLFSFLAALLEETSATPLEEPLSPVWLWIHTSLIFSGLVCLITAFSSAAMYLMQSAQLKSKKLGNIFLKFPSLGALDKIHFRSLAWGVFLFSLGILSGVFWAKNMNALGALRKDPKIALSFLTCFLYAVVLAFRLSAMRRGQKIALGTVILFALLFITLISSTFAPSGYHRGF